MDIQTQKKLIEYLSGFATAHKIELMNKVIQKRTRYVTIVLENIFQPHNMSAAIRSAECFGMQDVYIIEQRHYFKPNINISKGASNWVTLHHYGAKDAHNVETCFEQLRKNNYLIVATAPPRELLSFSSKGFDRLQESYELSKLPLDKKIALVFGTEETGISDYARDHADAFVTIPIVGFTESFNISVSVAICLYDIIMRMHFSEVDWRLTEMEKNDIYLQWLREIVRGSDLLEKKFLSK